MTSENINKLRDLKNLKFIDIEEISINQFHPDSQGLQPATEVHMIIMCKGAPYPLVMRFKGKKTLMEIVEALKMHGDEVFGK